MTKRVVEVENATMDQILSGEEINVTAPPVSGAAAGGDSAPAAASAERGEPAAADQPLPVTPAAAAPAETQAPEPEEDDEPEPDHSWVDSLPETHREKVRATLKGQRIALSRRRGKIETLQKQVDEERRERRAAIQVALQRSDELEEFRKRHETPAATSGVAPAATEFLEGELDADGKVKIPASAIAPLLERAQQPQREAAEAAQREQERLAVAARFADQLLADAKIPQETQNRLLGAFREMIEMYVAAARRTGAAVNFNTDMDEQKFMREQGIERQLQTKYPGIKLEYLYELFEGSKNPWRHGNRLVEISRYYTDQWKIGAPAAAAPAAPTKPRIPDHPGSLASGGGGDTHVESTLDEFLAVTPGDIINGRLSAEKTRDLETRWRQEMGVRER